MSIDVPSRLSAPETPDGLDPVRLIRGASRGFSVLAIGGAAQPLAGAIAASLGFVWLVIVAIAAFAIAAWQADEVPTPFAQGAATALGAYALVVPLVLMGAGTLPWDQVVFTALTAIAVGGCTARLRSSRRQRKQKV